MEVWQIVLSVLALAGGAFGFIWMVVNKIDQFIQKLITRIDAMAKEISELRLEMAKNQAAHEKELRLQFDDLNRNGCMRFNNCKVGGSQ
ncbi:hypothetical protein [Chrysiogenes arsenatis]|uniref:hypothetical protein n=1 Tax=Chrysiogenes arsenatis TaxID=309797 RepID=UPI00040FE75E|nr:hypothetical protein [Chrysiogenes arsenatis]